MLYLVHNNTARPYAGTMPPVGLGYQLIRAESPEEALALAKAVTAASDAIATIANAAPFDYPPPHVERAIARSREASRAAVKSTLSSQAAELRDLLSTWLDSSKLSAQHVRVPREKLAAAFAAADYLATELESKE